MAARNTPHTYGWVAKLFHWVMAALMLGMLALGYYMSDLPKSPFKFDLYWWHKSFGTLVLMLVAVRLAWKATNPRVTPVAMPRWQILTAKSVHLALYLLMFAMPLSGLVMSSAFGFPVSFFGLFTVPDMVAPDRALGSLAAEAHELGMYALFGLITLHVAGAFKHHFIDKDETLRRMLP